MAESQMYTTAVHAGEDPEAYLGSLSVPVYNSALFTFPDAEQGSAIHEGEQPGYFYGRMGNPTQAALESALTELEDGEASLALASGMAAVTTALMTVVEHGDHIVAPESLYATTFSLLESMLGPLGVTADFVDGTDPANYAAAIRPETKVLYLESPANPTMKLADIDAVVALAGEHGLTTIMDNTFATPFNQQPLTRGVDVVVHSATKYLGGHGDLVAGAIIGSRGIVERARCTRTRSSAGSSRRKPPGSSCAASGRWRCGWSVTTPTRWPSPGFLKAIRRSKRSITRAFPATRSTSSPGVR
ncbi:hypothetical protein BH23CHL2_BH23CHL2_23390 [soil metagenome]